MQKFSMGTRVAGCSAAERRGLEGGAIDRPRTRGGFVMRTIRRCVDARGVGKARRWNLPRHTDREPPAFSIEFELFSHHGCEIRIPRGNFASTSIFQGVILFAFFSYPEDSYHDGWVCEGNQRQ